MASTHIIIVNYNAGDWLVRSIGSALAFSSGPISVVDNASSDASIAQAKLAFNKDDMKRLRFIENDENLGFAAANNQILSSFNEDFAVLLNPDCELQEDSLPVILSELELNGKIGLASCQILNEDGSTQRTSRRKFPTPVSAASRILQLHRVFPNSLALADFDYANTGVWKKETQMVEAVSGAFMVVRRSAIDEVGLLDEEYFMHCEDLDWCKRFELANWKVASVGAAAVVHAKGVSSKSRPIAVLWTLHKGMLRFFNKFYMSKTSWWLGLIVKVGIAASFLVRAAVALFSGLKNTLFKGSSGAL